MSKRIWHSGPPPHIGWWNASMFNIKRRWRWWDGTKWSDFVRDDYNAEQAALRASYFYPVENVAWSDYYPKNARVPRIDPRRK